MLRHDRRRSHRRLDYRRLPRYALIVACHIRPLLVQGGALFAQMRKCLRLLFSLHLPNKDPSPIFGTFRSSVVESLNGGQCHRQTFLGRMVNV